MESHWAGRQSESTLAVTSTTAGVSRTCSSTLAIGIETGDTDAIKVVGGESGVSEKEKSEKGLQMHLVGVVRGGIEV